MANNHSPIFRVGILPVLLWLIAGVASAQTGTSGQAEIIDGSQNSLIVETESGTTDLPDDVYVDEYLLDDDEPMYGDYADSDEELTGRRYLAAELIYYSNDASIFGDQMERGWRVRWRRETLNFGHLEADLMLSDIQRSFTTEQRSNTEVVITLRQREAPINDTWMMNNTLGYQRTLGGAYAGGGYRVRLPSSPIMGMTGEVHDFARSAQWFSGRTGRIEGVALNQFENDGGTLSGVAYQQEISPFSSVFSEIVTFSGNELVPDHTSMLTSLRVLSEDHVRVFDVSILADDDGNFGVWSDAEHVLDANIVIRYGAYFLGPDLAWMDKPIANDEFGTYLRFDKQSYAFSLSTGYDYAQTGLRSDSLFNSEIHNVYFNGNLRVTRNLNLGTSGTVLIRNLESLQGTRQTTWRLNNYAFYRSLLGSSRFEFYVGRVDTGQPSEVRDTRGLIVSHQWRMPQSLRLTTELRVEDARTGSNSSNEREANVLFRQDLNDEFSWGLNASLFQASGQARSQDAIAVNADLRWGFMPDWYSSLIVSRNAARFDIDAPQFGTIAENKTTGNSVWLTVGYGRASGQPIQVLGESRGVGSGRVEGDVFFDENGDFIRQPGERPAVGVIVLLDGRYEARTDSLGHYRFEPVSTGAHQVSVIVSDLPLPWGLHNETPRIVNVSLRHSGDADFALVRLN